MQEGSHIRNRVSRGYYVALFCWRTNTMNRTSYRVIGPYHRLFLKMVSTIHDWGRTHHQEIPCIYDDGTWNGRNWLWVLWEIERIQEGSHALPQMFRGYQDLQLLSRRCRLVRASKSFNKTGNNQLNISWRTVRVQKSAWLGIREASSGSNTEAGTL